MNEWTAGIDTANLNKKSKKTSMINPLLEERYKIFDWTIESAGGWRKISANRLNRARLLEQGHDAGCGMEEKITQERR